LTFYDRGMSDSGVADRARPALDRVIALGARGGSGWPCRGASEPAGSSGPALPSEIIELVRRASGVVAAIFIGLTCATCGGGLPPPGHYGSPGYRFAISFAKAPTEQVVAITTPLPDAQYGTAIAHRSIWSGGNADVWVDQLTTPVPANRVDGFLRSHLPTSHGGRIVTRSGFPAAIESVPCFTPAGSCPGNVAVLAVLDDTTLYMVHTVMDASTDRAILASFQLENR